MDARIANEYRKLRKQDMQGDGRCTRNPGYALRALRTARHEVALQDAEEAGHIRFQWEQDDMEWENSDAINAEYARDPKEAHQYRTWARQWERNVKAGYRTVECCRAEVPCRIVEYAVQRTVHYDHTAIEWRTVASLCGIELDINDKHNYRREIERELADEAGLFDRTERAA